MDKFLLNKWLKACQSVDHAAILLSNNYDDEYGIYDAICCLGANQFFHNAQELNKFDGFAVGHISYQYKNELPYVHKSTKNKIQLPVFEFFEPAFCLKILRDGTSTETGSFDFDSCPEIQDITTSNVIWKSSTSKEKYLATVEEIRGKIRDGVFYEMNYCIEFSADAELNPYYLFQSLNETAPAPFTAFYKFGNRFLLCASPERFLQKQGNKLCSQPIKGTRKRIHGIESQTAAELFQNPKDRAENIMIVDLVRNDLSRVSVAGSVKVPELCGIYTYSHVHQMISTIVSNLNPGESLQSILEATFPMGSMTGAPKIEVMKHIDAFEDFSRELYSGSIGYWDRGDFDFNVVIRSLEIEHDQVKYRVGGAITFDSNPEEEYEECLTKATAMVDILKKK